MELLEVLINIIIYIGNILKNVNELPNIDKLENDIVTHFKEEAEIKNKMNSIEQRIELKGFEMCSIKNELQKGAKINYSLGEDGYEKTKEKKKEIDKCQKEHEELNCRMLEMIKKRETIINV